MIHSGSDIFLMPGESRAISGQDNIKTYIDPNADPLSIDSLMRPIDPQHSAEYLDKISGREYFCPCSDHSGSAGQLEAESIWQLAGHG